jgi:hypothetical protein
VKTTTLRNWLGFALFGLALWFFGNLYEEIVLMPNWLVASLDTLRAYNRYYAVVIQYHYYVPLTQLAVFVVTWLAFSRRAAELGLRPYLRRAAWGGWIGLALTALIVLNLNLDLFIGELRLSAADAHRLGGYWLIGNALRLVSVGWALWNTLRALLSIPRPVQNE